MQCQRRDGAALRGLYSGRTEVAALLLGAGAIKNLAEGSHRARLPAVCLALIPASDFGAFLACAWCHVASCLFARQWRWRSSVPLPAEGNLYMVHCTKRALILQGGRPRPRLRAHKTFTSLLLEARDAWWQFYRVFPATRPEALGAALSSSDELLPCHCCKPLS